MVSTLDDQNYNTTRKQVEGMKTIITFSVILLLAAAPIFVKAVSMFWKSPGTLINYECQLDNYACFKPVLSFASLH
jgi:hypothetical protein